MGHQNHTSLDQLLEHFDRSCEMMSSEDQEQEDTTVTDASTITSLPIASSSSLSSSILTSTTYDSTNTASTAKSSLKRKIRVANDDSDNEIVSTSTQRRCDDDNYQRSNNNSPKRMKRMKYARRNSVVIRDSKQLSQIATDLSTISKIQQTSVIILGEFHGVTHHIEKNSKGPVIASTSQITYKKLVCYHKTFLFIFFSLLWLTCQWYMHTCGVFIRL